MLQGYVGVLLESCNYWQMKLYVVETLVVTIALKGDQPNGT